MFELGRLFVEIVRNLVIAFGLFLLGVAGVSSIQSNEHALSFKDRFQLNLGIYKSNKSIEGPTVVSASSEQELIKVETKSALRSQNSHKSHDYVDQKSILGQLSHIEQLPAREKLDALKKLRQEAEGMYLAKGLTIDQGEKVFNEIQKRLYWTQKFLNIQDISSDDNSQLEPVMPSSLKKSKKLAKSI